MMNVPLPTVMDALIDYLMRRDGVNDRIAQGFKRGTKAMQAQFPLDARIRQERDRYQRDVVVAAMNGLMICNAIGAPVADPWNGLLPGPLFVQDKDLFEWLKGWAPTDAMNVMRAVIPGWKPSGVAAKKAPGKKPNDKQQNQYMDGAQQVPAIVATLTRDNGFKPNKDAVAAYLSQQYPGTSKSTWKNYFVMP